MKKNNFNHSPIASVTDGSGATDVCVLINGTPHLKFLKSSYLGLQSWYASKVDFKIEIYLSAGTIKLEYNSFEKWQAVLTIIDSQV